MVSSKLDEVQNDTKRARNVEEEMPSGGRGGSWSGGHEGYSSRSTGPSDVKQARPPNDYTSVTLLLNNNQSKPRISFHSGSTAPEHAVVGIRPSSGGKVTL
ncbi:unnamed protein product [Haemonchus placei]|uniref:Whirlin n=1 Tax=Haemonchus placei TaxID=6290 RepID=A0A0N4X9G8_HAEPC|nr:unnamed protein product [Haemonchus placei]